MILTIDTLVSIIGLSALAGAAALSLCIGPVYRARGRRLDRVTAHRNALRAQLFAATVGPTLPAIRDNASSPSEI